MIELTDLQKLTDDHIAFAEEYRIARLKAAKAKEQFYIILTSLLPEIRKQKRNIGLEMANIEAMRMNDMAKQLWGEWQEEEAKYKGLEKLIEAIRSKISLSQSIMKWAAEKEITG